MTWLAWRQFRTSALVAIGGAIIIVALLAITTHGNAQRCPDGCAAGGEFLDLTHVRVVNEVNFILDVLPALIGAFWGAPLIAREWEAGTHRLIWTQSVSRSRWLALRAAAPVFAAGALCGLITIALGLTSNNAVQENRLVPSMFGVHGIAPVGYAVFAVAIGILAGTIIRRTLPAMTVTLVVFVAFRLAIENWVRPHLAPLTHTTTSLAHSLGIAISPSGVSLFPAGINLPGAWTVSSRVIDASGHAPSQSFLLENCIRPTGRTTIHRCMHAVTTNFHDAIAYQPASHFWPIQLAETGLFLGLAAVLLASCFRWVNRRLT